MRIFSALAFFLLLCNLTFSQVSEISLIKKRGELKSISKTTTGIRLSFTQGKLFNKTTIAKDGGSYTDIWLKGSYPNGEVGSPKLPAYKKLIRIPKGTKPIVKVVSCSEQLINLNEKGINQPIYPNQPSVRKDQDSAEIKFQIKKAAYLQNTFSNAPIATIEVLGNLRSATIARVVVNPVDYNPGNGLLKVYNDIDVDVTFDSPTSVDDEQDFNAKTASPFFDIIYKSLEEPTKSSYTDHPDLTKYPVKMLIICNRMFEQTIKPLVEWKKLIGFNVKTVYTDEIGTTAEQIKTYIKQDYDSATTVSPAPTFLVIVGDVGLVAASATGSQTAKSTDLYYASVDDDMFPDMYYGRLSATTTTELENIINKILYYEKYQFEDPTYLNNVTLIAGADSEWNPKVGQPTIKYGTANYFNQAKGFVNVNEYGVTADPNNTNASSLYTGCYSTDRIAVGLINYTAHCDITYWYEPYLSASSVSSFTNTNKYPLTIGNCCLSGDFGATECIGEAWIRAQSKGAVTYIGSSPSTYWLEDFYWSVGAFPMVGDNNGYVPTFQETTTGMYDAPFVSKYVTTGGMVFAGNLAVTEVDVQNYPSQSSPTYYWQAYNILGDPSLMPYFTEAESNQVSHNQTITVGESSFLVSALADSYVAISKDNQLLGTSYGTTTGEVSVPFDPITSTGDVVVVVTRPQTIPYIDTIIAISPTSSYLILDSLSIDDHLSNNNSTVDYNELFGINLAVKNIGVEDATNVRVKVSGTDNNIYIDGIDSISMVDIPQKEGFNIININNAFSFKTKENIPDQYVANFTLTFYSDQGSWTSRLKILLNSPVLTLGEIKIDDNLGGNKDGLLNSGETCKVFVPIINKGHALATDITFHVSIPDSIKNNVSVSDIQTEPFSLEANSFSTLPFNISVNPSFQQEFSIPITLEASVVEPSGQSATFERIIVLSSNVFNISNDTVTNCFSNFYDSGGSVETYQNSENYTATFVAKNEYSLLKVDFAEFSTESGWDFLYIYDGPNINSPQVTGSPFSGATIPDEIISSSRYITFRFTSDDDTAYKGWAATIECIDPQSSSCVTSPSPSDGATAVQSGTLSWATSSYATYYDIYLGFSPTNLALVARVETPEFNFKPEKSKTYYWKVIPGNYLGSNNSSCNTWSFTTDVITSSYDVLMSNNSLSVDTVFFYDSGGSNQNYKNSENQTLTLKPKYLGNTLSVQFLSFNIESQSLCSYDKLSIYNGLTTSSPILGAYCGTTSPGTVLASNSDGALTFLFYSDNSTTYSGWKALVKSLGSVVLKTVTVMVQYNSSLIENASINIGGVIKLTDNTGMASFAVTAGDLNVTVNALDYKELNRIVADSETSSTIIINLEKLSTVNIHVFNKKTLNAIPRVKIRVENDSTFTSTLGLAALQLTPGTYTLALSLDGYIPYNQQLIVDENDTNLEISLEEIKYQVSIIVSDVLGNKIDSALVGINDTTLTTNSDGLALGYFPLGSYPITVSKLQFVPISTWLAVNDAITKNVYLDETSSLYNIDFTIICSGPKSIVPLYNNDVDLYFSNILYSRFKTDINGTGRLQLPKGNFYYNISREGYYSIVNTPFLVDGIKNSIQDTIDQETFTIQFNVSSQSAPIQDASIILEGYLPEITNSLGQTFFTEIGYEKNLRFIVQRDGFVDTIGYINAVNPLVVSINLLSTDTPLVTTNKIKIFPNPTSDRLSVETDKPITRITVVNTLGAIVLNKNYSYLNSASISLGGLNPGAYILIVYCENAVPEKALVIKK